MAEVCAQCKHSFEGELPIVAILNAADAEKLEVQSVLKMQESNGSNWVASPVCDPCWKAPTIKAHFFFRNQWKRALANAGSSDL